MPLAEKDIEKKFIESPLTTEAILSGQKIDPVATVSTYGQDEFERLINEWLTESVEQKYDSIKRCGGSGDMGRDVIAYVDPKKATKRKWDNFQCKHYSNPLTPSEAALEVGKHIYYTFKKEYTCAENYFFVCPKDVGPKLISLLEDADKLKTYVDNNWSKYCEKNITSKQMIKLESNLRSYFDSFNFSIFDCYPIQKLISDHKNSRFFPLRFGGGLIKTRKSIPSPPEAVADHEAPYVSKLFKVYGEKIGEAIGNLEDLKRFQEELVHFEKQRVFFYSAESLKEFGRDNLPDEGNYYKLIVEFQDAISTLLDGDRNSGFERLQKTLIHVATIIVNHPLNQEIKQKDRYGICHQIANNNKKFGWVIR